MMMGFFGTQLQITWADQDAFQKRWDLEADRGRWVAGVDMGAG
jgi:hypothetical protein